jgi:hypothetical protein
VNCEQTFMARKMNSPKLGRQNNAAPQAFSRRNAPPVAALYLMQLRTQALKISSSQPRRVRVQINLENGAETPQPVKIKKKD